MERYFILMIIVTLVGVIPQKKNRQETNSWNTRQEETKMVSAIPCEDCLNYANVLKPYSKFKTSSDVVNEEKIYEIVANKNSIPTILKSWNGRSNKMSGSTNPRGNRRSRRPVDGCVHRTDGRGTHRHRSDRLGQPDGADGRRDARAVVGGHRSARRAGRPLQANRS